MSGSPYWARLTDATARSRGVVVGDCDLVATPSALLCSTGLRRGKEAAILYGSRTVISHDPNRPGAALHVEPLAPSTSVQDGRSGLSFQAGPHGTLQSPSSEETVTGSSAMEQISPLPPTRP
jgi:hypothetical protein